MSSTSFKFEFDEKTLHLICQGLGTLPYAVAAPILADVQKQYDAQNKPKGKK